MSSKNYLSIYAKSFNWAGFFLPKKTYQKCSSLYDFCRIVDNIADFNFLMDGVDARVTISGGMSEYPKHSENTKDLIEFADQAMYATKQKGGNGIITHGNEVESHDKKNI